jgi:hypothetical protein
VIGNPGRARHVLQSFEVPRTPLLNARTFRSIMILPGKGTVALRYANGVVVEEGRPRSPTFRESFVHGFLSFTRGWSCGSAGRAVSWYAIAPGRTVDTLESPEPATIDFMNGRIEIVASTYRYSAHELFPIVASIVAREADRRRTTEPSH